jgi:endoglucanase
MDFLGIRNGKIVDRKDQPVSLRGVNLGGWLMMEGYILGGRHISEHIFKAEIAKASGKNSLEQFEKSFRGNFIQKEDFNHIHDLGATCIRLPFHYKIVKEKQWHYLDQALSWAKGNKIYVILDMHAAPGSQNADWHSDSKGEALLWRNKKYREQTYQLWSQIAQRYKNEPVIAAYDILNEAVGDDLPMIKETYVKITKAIRATGDQHIIFVEGHNWSQEFDFLGKPWDSQMGFSFHYYLPGDFTFNCVRNLRYPGKINGELWNRKKMESILRRYVKFQQKYRIPIYCGEFGVNSRCPDCAAELAWVRDVLEIFKKYGIHYTYWTYKAVAGGLFPDGIYQYLDNPSWINRWSKATGVETFAKEWPKRKKEMADSWQTKSYVKNQKLSRALKTYFKKK